MDKACERTMNRVIGAMYERIGDELTVDELARTARYSKFHFSRIFRQATGVSPGRFLSALRFQHAKRLLAGTSLSVAEISNLVGYSSLGTFSTRFKRFVGVTPTEYRHDRSGWLAAASNTSRPAVPDPQSATLTGQVCAGALAGRSGQTLIGLFADRVPAGPPVRFSLQASPGNYVLRGVPAGTWYVLANGVYQGEPAPEAGGRHASTPYVTEPVTGSVGRLGPITVPSGATIELPELRLRPMGAVDPPLLCTPFVAMPGEMGRTVVSGWSNRTVRTW